MEVVAITVCVNYDDILKYVLASNARLLHHWYIVTSPTDIATAKLIASSNLSNITLLIYTDFYNGATFNKGGALHYAQDLVSIAHTGKAVLVLDADILLPDYFTERLPTSLENDTMYGVSARNDYWTVEDFILETNPHPHEYGANFAGFFQLYKESHTYRYKHSVNCSHCDLEFRDLFPKKINLDMSLKHLGKDCVNWEGRKSCKL
jgi:hypothetical protein